MQITPFTFGTQPVRIVDHNGQPYFVGKDVATLLGYVNPTKAVRDICKGGLKQTLVTETRGAQTFHIIPESDIYRLVLRSNAPNAEKFQAWICEEVLPSIRRNGGYGIEPADTTPPQFNHLRWWRSGNPGITRQHYIEERAKIVHTAAPILARESARLAQALSELDFLAKPQPANTIATPR